MPGGSLLSGDLADPYQSPAIAPSPDSLELNAATGIRCTADPQRSTGSLNGMIVVAAVDGSEHADKVLEAAITFAGDGHIHLVYVTRPPVYPGEATDMGPVVVMTDIEEIRDAEAQGIWDKLGKIPANATAHTLQGPAAHSIVEFAQELDADLIIVGSRGRGAMATLLLGSVSHGVVHAADRNVLIVR